MTCQLLIEQAYAIPEEQLTFEVLSALVRDVETDEIVHALIPGLEAHLRDSSGPILEFYDPIPRTHQAIAELHRGSR